MSEYDLNNPQSDVESYLANMDGVLAPLPLPPESNVEKYLAHIVGVQGVELPNKPDSRVEAYLEKLALDPPQPVTPILIEKQITNNGVYSASDDSADGYSKVTVEVPDPVLDELVATVNGEYNPTHDGYSKVTVQVPDPALETLSVTENGEYTPTAYGYSRVTVSVQPPANSYQLKSITTPTSLATFNASEMPMPKLKVSVEAQQDLHGYDKPWVGGAGKNKLPLTIDTIKSLNTGGTWSNNTYSINGGTLTIMTDNSGNVVGIDVNGTFSTQTDIKLVNSYGSTDIFIGQGSYYINCANMVAGTEIHYGYGSSVFGILNNTSDKRVDITGANPGMSFALLRLVSNTLINTTLKPMIRLATETDSTFAPYSNICPISGWDNAIVTDTDDVDNPTVTQTTTISLPQTVYGGELDVVNGGGKNNLAYVELPSTGWQEESGVTGVFTHYAIKAPTAYPQLICSHSTRASSYNDVINNDNRIGLSASRVIWHESSFANVEELEQYLANNTVQIAYELATPTTLTTQPTPIKSLEGTNNFSVDCGEIMECEWLEAL